MSGVVYGALLVRDLMVYLVFLVGVVVGVLVGVLVGDAFVIFGYKWHPGWCTMCCFIW